MPCSPHPRRSWLADVPLAAALLATLIGCSSGGGGAGAPLVAGFTPGTPAAAGDLVRLRAASIVGDTVVLEVALGGPTSNTDLYAFAFDLVLGDPAVAEFVTGSEQDGAVLVPGAGQGVNLLLVSQQGDRVVVGLSKSSGGAGDGVAAGEAVVLSLTFRVLAPGSTTLTFAGSPTNPLGPQGQPTALDSNLQAVAGIAFDAAAAEITAQ